MIAADSLAAEASEAGSAMSRKHLAGEIQGLFTIRVFASMLQMTSIDASSGS